MLTPPTGASWLNLVERFFAEITRKRIRRGVFTSVAELEDTIHDYLERHNADPKPFVWTKSAKSILEREARAKRKLDDINAGCYPTESEHSDVPSQALRTQFFDAVPCSAAIGGLNGSCSGGDEARRRR